MQSEARRMAAEKCWPYPWRFRVNSTHVRELAGVLDPGPCFNFGIGPNTLAGMPFVLDETIRRARLETYRAG
jgi:hypothetical protein